MNFIIKRGDVFLIDLNPTMGNEIQKRRPCVILSPNVINDNYSTYIIAPLSTGNYLYPFRIPCVFLEKHAHIILDQIRAIDNTRLIAYKGSIDNKTLEQCLTKLQEIFAI